MKMASDVRWFFGSYVYPLIFLVSFLISHAFQTDEVEVVEVVSSEFFLEDISFFELIEPREIAYIYKIRPAKNFGTSLNYTLGGVELVVALPQQSCSHITNANYISGNVALVERGGCSFLAKAMEAEHAGAIAVIITDNDVNNDDTLIEMITDGSSNSSNIPAFFMLGKDGYMIMKTLHELNMQSATINIPINITGSSALPRRLPPWSLW